jgi:nitroreductase
MDALECIKSRRSVREFTDEPVTAAELRQVIEAGCWAPSGLNNQPWRFAVVRDETVRAQLAGLTKYGHIVSAAPVCIAVLCDRRVMYNDVKDHQSMGACLQNMLLASHAMGLGAVWLGEILNRAAEVNTLLGLPESLELMAVVALGHPQPATRTSSRKETASLIVKEL